MVFHLTYRIEKYITAKFQLFIPAQMKATGHFLQFNVEREETIKRHSLQESLLKGGLSQEEIDAILREHTFHNAKDRQALEICWQQFL